MTELPAGSWRLSDADRLAAVEALGEHYAAGRLDQAEYDERSEEVMAARTPPELHPAFADLPLPHGSLAAAAPAAPAVERRPGPVDDRSRGSGSRHWLLLIALVLLVAHAPVLLIAALALVVLARRRRGWAHRGPRLRLR